MNVKVSPKPPVVDATDPDFLVLNKGQQDAANAIFQFLFSNEKEFMVSGPAGTGKTHLMKYVMTHTMKEYATACSLLGVPFVDFTIGLCATTNKATEVLARSTGFAAQTIHSFMNLRVADNYETGKSDIKPTRAWLVHTRTLIFIDEASMIDTALHKFILQGTDNSCKIIYLGDHCQLAPVFETISPVYKNPKRASHLTQPMRNANQPALMALCNQLRHTVETLDFHRIREVPGVIDYVDATGAYAFIDTVFKPEDPPARALAYSNARVQEYNHHIRDLRGYPGLFTKGEVLVNSTAIPLRKGDSSYTLPVESEITILAADSRILQMRVEGHEPNSAFEYYEATCKTPLGLVFDTRLPVSPDRMNELRKYYARVKNWERVFWLRDTFPDFRQKDAATVYKAQGSTYKTVFLDLSNIGTCKHNDQLARMLYVGASRATTRLVLFGELPKRLFK